MDPVAGVTLMLVRGALVTVMLDAGEVMPYIAAVTVVVPPATPVTIPVALPTLATAVAAEVQVTRVVISAVVPSE